MNGSRNVLIVDPDPVHCTRLGKEFLRHHFEVHVACDGLTALEIVRTRRVDDAVVELQLPDHSGLMLLEKLRFLGERFRVVMLASRPSIATAVEAIKLGATQYLPKPVHPGDVVAALDPAHRYNGAAAVSEPLSLDALIWEHIERVLYEHGGNVSATARALDMHRRTLQRRLRQRDG